MPVLAELVVCQVLALVAPWLCIHPSDIVAVPIRAIDNIEHEIDIFRDALIATREEIGRLAKRLTLLLPDEEASLFDVYLKILEKDSIGSEVESIIKEQKVWAQWALAKVIKRYIAQFEQMEDPIFA